MTAWLLAKNSLRTPRPRPTRVMACELEEIAAAVGGLQTWLGTTAEIVAVGLDPESPCGTALLPQPLAGGDPVVVSNYDVDHIKAEGSGQNCAWCFRPARRRR